MDRYEFAVHPEVAEALASGGAVVALESTIVAHGMPYPRNVETARRVEAAVREAGAVPATVAVLGGRIRVGLGADELERLGRGEGVAKVSRRDLPVVVATGRDGATTVAATMIVAERAGIRVFATGGIGGVHPGAGASFDVSADLDELARTSVAVVCSGAKSILDLGATLEVLETRGVPVLGYRTADFPAFYVRSSGHALDHRADSVEELAGILRAKYALGLAGGVVVANPIPEDDELDPDVLERALRRATEEAERQGVAGKRLTPFLLERLHALTGGQSLDANVALILANARLAARLAQALGGDSPTP